MKRTVAAVVTAVSLTCGGYYAGQQQAPESVGRTAHAEPRSGHWPKVRADHLAAHPTCTICGATADVEVHHCRPFHEHPELELDPDNLITLCRRHHFTFGHLERWSSHNESVRDDAANWAAKIGSRP